MKKFIDNYLLVFIMFIPFLYLYISYGIKVEVDLKLLGFILFSFLFAVGYLYLLVNKDMREVMIGYLIFMLLAIGFTFINNMNSFDNIQFILTILYFPVYVLFFSNYENKWLNKKYISYVYLIFAVILTISYMFRFNYELALEYKKGFIGLFYGANVISPIMAVLMPIALEYANKSKSYFVKGLFYVTTIVSVLFLGTKTIYASLVVYFIYCLGKYFKKKPHVALIVATMASSLVVILPMIPQYQNFRTEKIYNAMKDDTSLYNEENVDKFLFGFKLSKTRNTFEHIYERNSKYNLAFGTDYNYIGIDYVDIFFTIGAVGLILYIGFLVYAIYQSRIKGLYLILFGTMFLASFFQGNIFTNYYVYIFVALLFLFTHQEEDDRTRILVVSNMYPSKKNQSYGIFVKNVIDRLALSNRVDKVVMTKHNNIITKAIAYIIFHISVVVKMTFNNYDYVYVHFISHSSKGVVFASHFVKNTKIVFNAHGNDVVADREVDKKNISKSKKYLKYAYKVVVPSEYFKEVMVNEYKIKDKNVVVYPSGGVDLSLFKELDKKESKQALELDNKTKYIGYVSRIDTDKGYDTFVEAINVLSKDKKFSKYKFLIIGDGEEKSKLLHMIKNYNLEDVIIYKNKVSREELALIYNSLDMFVFPTRRKSESLGLVGLEAMACGCTTITTNVYGPSSYIKNKKNGYTFKYDKYEDLVEVIKTVSSLKEEDLDKIKKNAIKTASLYDSSTMDSILKKVFK
jgi:glycosyltransferase involved in cell wall biosynthesis